MVIPFYLIGYFFVATISCIGSGLMDRIKILEQEREDLAIQIAGLHTALCNNKRDSQAVKNTMDGHLRDLVACRVYVTEEIRLLENERQ